MKRISFPTIRTRFVAMCTRFPITLAFILAFTVCSICVSHEVITEEKLCFFALFYTSSAALLSTVLRLWDEETDNHWLSRGVQLVIQLGWLGFMIYFVSEWEPGIIRLTALISLMAAMVAAGFLVSFTKEKTDLPLWHFTFRTLFAAITAVVVGGIFWGGITLLFTSFKQLFSLQLWNNVWSDIAIVCLGFITPILFLQLLPGGEHKHDRSNRGMPHWANAVVHYLFVPLTVAYLVTLYAYAAKILITWQLPNGWVSWLVSVLVLLMVILTVLFYPSRFDGSRWFDRTFTRLLPMLVLPLLLLMTIGIVRRFNDYGITVPRLYLALFNLWCYGVCLWLIVRNPKRVAWIPVSFIILLVAASVGPQSFANITLHSLSAKVKTTMKANGISHFPLNDAAVKKWQRDTTNTHRQASDQLYYLTQTYKQHELSQLADSSAIKQVIRFENLRAKNSIADIIIRSPYVSHQSFPVPPNRSHCTTGYFRPTNIRLTGDKVSCEVLVNEDGKDRNLPLEFSIKQLKALQSRQRSVYVITMSQVTVSLTSLEYSIDKNDLHFVACIFY